MTERPIEELTAGDEFRDSMVARADAHRGAAPLWHGWVIMDAFLAGIDYAKARDVADAAISKARGGKSARDTDRS